MMRHEYTSHAYGVELMTGLLGVDETEKQWGVFICIPFLKRLYEKHLSQATQLDNATREEEERDI